MIWAAILLFFVFCSNAANCKLHSQIYNDTFSDVNYHWQQVLPFGSGSFPEDWEPGTFPLGVFPIAGFEGNLWMIGQKYEWISSDGLNWKRYKKHGWSERIYSVNVFFKNKLWMMGGMDYEKKEFLNDIWFSDDGKTWQLAKNAEWKARGAHALLVFKNKLWLFGGANGVNKDRGTNKFLNDIWSSEDGINWVLEISSAPWTSRDYPRMLIFNDTLYMIGGQGQPDIWRSPDCKNWEMLNPKADWKERYDYGALVYDNKIWVFGGRDTSSNHTIAAKNDVWYSEDGIKWIRQTEHAPWTVRSALHSLIFRNKLWIFSGKHTGGKFNWGGDIWTMSRLDR